MTRREWTEYGYPVVGVERYLGFCAELAEKVALNVGYEYHLRMVWDAEYGKTNKDGTWNGMIGELIRHVCTVFLRMKFKHCFMRTSFG